MTTIAPVPSALPRPLPSEPPRLDGPTEWLHEPALVRLVYTPQPTEQVPEPKMVTMNVESTPTFRGGRAWKPTTTERAQTSSYLGLPWDEDNVHHSITAVAGGFEDAVRAASSASRFSTTLDGTPFPAVHAVLEASDGAWYVSGLGTRQYNGPMGPAWYVASLATDPDVSKVHPAVRAVVGADQWADLREAEPRSALMPFSTLPDDLKGAPLPGSPETWDGTKLAAFDLTREDGSTVSTDWGARRFVNRLRPHASWNPVSNKPVDVLDKPFYQAGSTLDEAVASARTAATMSPGDHAHAVLQAGDGTFYVASLGHSTKHPALLNPTDGATLADVRALDPALRAVVDRDEIVEFPTA